MTKPIEKKSFPCNFELGVVCPHKKTARFALFGRCFKCSHYQKFMRDMDEEDQRVMDEIERERDEINELRSTR